MMVKMQITFENNATEAWAIKNNTHPFLPEETLINKNIH